MLSRTTRFSALKRWAMDVAKRRGMKRAKVALARKLAVVLRRIWVNGSAFRWSKINRLLPHDQGGKQDKGTRAEATRNRST
jgi:hypothetical protein